MKNYIALTKRSSLFTLLPVALWLTAFVGPDNSSITVTIDAIENTKGRVVFMLFNQEEGFPREVDKAWKVGKIKPQSSQATYTFSDVPYGTYAIAVFHDEDGDGAIDTNFIGLPQERVGATNMSSMGKPSFSKCQIVVEEPAKTIPLQFIN